MSGVGPSSTRSAIGPAGSDVAVRGACAGGGVEAFLAAAREGDFDALLELLDPR
jgi:hypothetical protein